MNVKTVLGLLEAQRRSTKLGGYTKKLYGPRNHQGSSTKKGLEDLDPSTPIEEFCPEDGACSPSCRYYVCKMGLSIGAKTGAIPYAEAKTRGLVVNRVTDSHGDYLVTDGYPTRTFWVTIIVGQEIWEDGEEPRDTVLTWYPGRPLALLTEDGPVDATAVKFRW